MASLKFKKGDRVVVLAGRDKGKQGEILKMIPKENRAIVRGVNVVQTSPEADSPSRMAGSFRRKHRSICPTWHMRIRRMASRPASVSNSSKTARKFGSPNARAS